MGDSLRYRHPVSCKKILQLYYTVLMKVLLAYPYHNSHECEQNECEKIPANIHVIIWGEGKKLF